MRDRPPGRAAAPRPLAAWTWLRRNPRRVLPVAVVQALVTALLVVVITPTNAFETTSEAYLRVMRQFTIVTPRTRYDFDEELTALLDANPAMEGRAKAKALWIRTPMIVGEAYSPLLAVDRDRQEEFLARIGARLVEGDLPERGSHGAAIHEAILKARGLSLGDEFGQVLDEEDATPGFFKVVGVLEGDARLGVIDLDYASLAASVLARRESFEVVYARPGGKEASDRHLRDARQADGAPAFRVIDEAFARRRVERSMENLPLLIGFLTGAVALIVALVTCLLNLISFQSRLDEFALYLALGHRRGRLARKLSVETGLTALLGWLVGLVVGFLALWIWRESVLVEKGILVSLLDMRPLAFSLAVPVLSFSVSALALARRLHRMDAVAVIQRRAA